MRHEASIESVEARAYRIPTEGPEADGTYAWSSTTLVTVTVSAGGDRGFGYSYGSAAMVVLIRDQLAEHLLGLDAFAVEEAWGRMLHEVRNVGRPGIASTAISAIDAALWDLKAKLLELPLVKLLGAVRDSVPVYGSGGFTNYSMERLQRQLASWVDSGIARVKMKVGADPERDLQRVTAARHAVGDDTALMVDANGAYLPREALTKAGAFADLGVVWFEEPVSSDDLGGLRWIRSRAPAPVAVAAGEYGYDAGYFRRMLDEEAVDVLQADATRCLGITGFLIAARLCEVRGVPLSAHTAPALHLHVACGSRSLVHIEYFHDHARIEAMLLDGFMKPISGRMAPDLSRPGLGIELKRQDAESYAL